MFSPWSLLLETPPSAQVSVLELHSSSMGLGEPQSTFRWGATWTVRCGVTTHAVSEDQQHTHTHTRFWAGRAGLTRISGLCVIAARIVGGCLCLVRDSKVCDRMWVKNWASLSFNELQLVGCWHIYPKIAVKYRTWAGSTWLNLSVPVNQETDMINSLVAVFCVCLED